MIKMKIGNEITSYVKMHTLSRLQIELWVKDELFDFFTLDLVNRKVQKHLMDSTKLLLDGVEYDNYIELLDDLGLEIPLTNKRHWAPKTGEGYFYINSEGEVCQNYITNFGYNEVDQKRHGNYNMFPTRELAEKTINISKLGRLILLWQYTNNCIFTPNWKNSQRKCFIKHDHINNTTTINYGITAQFDTVYFETEEQVKEFIKTYNQEVKKIMGVI